MPRTDYPPGAIIEFLDSDTRWMDAIYDMGNFFLEGESRGRHVEIVTGINRSVGAVSGGVQPHWVQDTHKRKCRVLWPSGATKHAGIKAAKAAEREIGQPYDAGNYFVWLFQIMIHWLKHPWRRVRLSELYQDNDNRWYCYELVDHAGTWRGAWNQAGVDITPGEPALPQSFQKAINESRLIVIDQW